MPDRLRIAITGGNGFVGRALLSELWENNRYALRLLVRNKQTLQTALEFLPSHPDLTLIQGSLHDSEALVELLSDVDIVIHLAAIAHRKAPASEHKQVSIHGTQQIITNYQRYGRGKRFIFISSIRAQRGLSCEELIYDQDRLEPQDAYGHAKAEAEYLCSLSSLDWTILRPTPIIDAEAQGQIQQLIRLALMPFPLPLAGVKGRRSFISRDALIKCILFCLENRETYHNVYNVAHDKALSLQEMIQSIRRGYFHHHSSLIAYSLRYMPFWPCPPSFLHFFLRVSGRLHWQPYLTDSLVVAGDGLSALGWQPFETAEQAFEKACAAVSAPSGSSLMSFI